MTLNELRQKYLDFMIAKGNREVASASLIPENDPTTLFTSAGMQPMMPYLLGEKHPQGTRLVDSQKCFRTGDIDEVGDTSHSTIFEMLGNWSFGDYFKKEQIAWMFEFLVEVIKLDPARLYVTAFRGLPELGIPQDTEAAELWQKLFKSKGLQCNIVEFPERDGLKPGDRMFYYDENKNWWSRAGVTSNMPIGEPGGPDSEMFWDFGADLNLHENSKYKNELCHPNCSCGRFMEIGNNVFMQYIKTAKGFEELPAKNIDFGGGLERICAALNDNYDFYRNDVFAKPMAQIEILSGQKYEGQNVYAFRVILDHLKAATFLIGDGAYPSNKDQGYFTRRLIRRAVRFAHKLGIKETFTSSLAQLYIDYYQEAYKNLADQKDKILAELKKEEEKFANTLEKGLKLFEKLSVANTISGKDAFDLFATYGFPYEMTVELALEKGIALDKEAFDQEFKQHQAISRAGSEQKFKGGLADSSVETTKLHTATHLLQAALRQVLGHHVAQKGSNITAERLRFDFVHPDKMTDEQKQQTEDLVNDWIKADYEMKCEELPYDEARARNIIGLFEDKYGAMVKVYSAGEISAEMCGGPHVKRTGELGHFKIQKEESSSAGIRRIKAVLG